LRSARLDKKKIKSKNIFVKSDFLKKYSDVAAMKRLFALSILLLAAVVAKSQQNDTRLADLISSIEDSQTSDENKAEMIEELHRLIENPCNLNTASDYQLSLIGLTAWQIRNLRYYLKNSGQIFSIHELKVINGFSDDLIAQIQPFICAFPVVKQPSLRMDSVFMKAKHSFRTQFRQIQENAYGFTRDKGGYMGTKLATNFRYTLDYFDRLSFSLTGEKDAGEPFFNSLQPYGYDNYSFQLTAKHIGVLEQLTLGDYRLNFGEGLAIGQFFDLGYFNSNAEIKRKSNGIKPYRSVTEFGFNRGLATLLRIGHLDIYLFGSYDRIDYSGSILQTGYHRTLSEISRKDSNTCLMSGFHLEYVSNGWTVGGTWLGYMYKYPISHQSSAYQDDYFTGRYNNISALNLSYDYRKLRLFSEVAVSANQAFASVAGFEYDIDYKTHFAVSYRHYTKAFQNFYSSAIGVQSQNANENGIYTAFTHRISKHWHYFLGFDYFHFPYISYRADTPIDGYKAKAELTFVPTEQHLVSLYYRLNNRPYNEQHPNGEVYPEDNILNQIQLKYVWQPMKALSINLRGGYSFTKSYLSDSLSGFFGLIDLSYSALASKLDIHIRYAFFNTDDYDNRFNVYEYNLPLNFSTTALYDKGHRVYAYALLRITRHIQVSARYAVTIYSDKQEIGSSNDKIIGNKRQEIGLQLHLKL
jgi:hypothetical protein